MQADGWKSIQLRLMFIKNMLVLAQGTNSHKEIRDLRDSQVIQEQINTGYVL